MKNFIKITFVLIIFFSSNCFAENIISLAQRAKQTCQCQSCNLKQSDFSNFKPGSMIANENPFTHSDNNNQASCWLSCNFKNANLSDANFSNTNFTVCLRGYVTPLANADFSNANLSNASLSNSKFYGVHFDNADLSHANLTSSDLSLSLFHGANFSRAVLVKAISRMDAMHGWGADMSNANFSNAILAHAFLYANFQGANFSNAKLTNAHLSTSSNIDPAKHLSAADLWKDVNFTDANLRGAHLVDRDVPNQTADLSKAILCHTIMPDGKINNRDCKK